MELIFTQHNNSNYYKCALNNLNYMRHITTLKSSHINFTKIQIIILVFTVNL